ncbi:hypothetical protein BGZ95_009592 [Linnemannia exigua]|uniref:Uncharacterized protein n=1 Tax=Linnemannia exigua TaxID=604196 RepID=A0AAD4DCP8_9FUNG|nr:hypothetical protein BGZ95_009592 [Linnemannia exigua]
MHFDKRLLPLLLSLLLAQCIAAAISVIPVPSARSASRYVIENQLPIANQTHEVIRVDKSNVVLISQMSNSVLLKARVDTRGVIQEIGAFQIGEASSALHGLAPSKRYPGKVWLTLQKSNKLVLIDPIVAFIKMPPMVLKEIDVPAPGLGPHYVGEYEDELWSTLQDSSDVLRINYNNPKNYTIYKGLPRPIFIAQHPINKQFYTGEDNSASIMKIEPTTGKTTQLPVDPSAGATPVGLISGPKGLWFTLLGSSTKGTGTFGHIREDDTITYHTLTSTLEWKNIKSEDIVVTPTQLNKAHRILITPTNVFATELASSKLDTSSYESVLDEFDKELNRVIRYPAAARYMEQMFEKAELSLQNGERQFAFIISRGTERLMSGAKAHVYITKRRAPEVIEDTKSNVAIGSHAYGPMVCLEDYKLHDNNDPFWRPPFPNNGELLTTILEGKLIQSGDDILLVYKVEVYGTADYEDPYAQEVARPEGMHAFKVENICHDQTHKVMVGTL